MNYYICSSTYPCKKYSISGQTGKAWEHLPRNVNKGWRGGGGGMLVDKFRHNKPKSKFLAGQAEYCLTRECLGS